MKNKLLTILNILMWICCIISITIRPFSDVIAWVFFGLEIVCVLGIFVVVVIELIQLNRREKKFKQELREMFLNYCSIDKEDKEG